MAEFTKIELQEVALNGNVVFDETPVCPTRCITHREGSGIVRLNGAGSNGRARFLVAFSGNIQIPAGGTVEEISLALATNGEAVGSTIMRVTPAADEDFWNVASSVFLDVPCGCCSQISVRNTSTQAILVQNANLIIERVA